MFSFFSRMLPTGFIQTTLVNELITRTFWRRWMQIRFGINSVRMRVLPSKLIFHNWLQAHFENTVPFHYQSCTMGKAHRDTTVHICVYTYQQRLAEGKNTLNKCSCACVCVSASERPPCHKRTEY